MNKKKIRQTEEVWVSKLGRLAVIHASQPELFWIIKKAFRQKGYRRIGTL